MANYKIESSIQQEFSEKHYNKFELDRLKKQAFIFPSAPLVSKYTVEMSDLRRFVYADVYSRYLNYKGFNSYLGVTINNTSENLYDNISNRVLSRDDPYSQLLQSSYNDLQIGDICFDNKIDSHSNEFIQFIQDAFLKLLNYNHIIKKDYFYLDFNSIKQEVINELIEVDMFDELKSFLNYETGLLFELQTSNNEALRVLLKDPEYISGINFICIKSNSNLAKKYFLDSERDYILQALKKKKNIGVFSGNFAINPLTNEEIPIIISSYFKEEIRIGNPNLNDDDLLFSSILGLSYKQIIEISDGKKTLINSLFLDGLTVEEAHKVIIDECLNSNTASYYEDIGKTSLKISMEYDNGISIPYFTDEAVDIKQLPVLIDRKNKVKTLNNQLSDKEIINQVFNEDITQSFLSLAIRLKNKFGITKYSSLEFILDFKDFPKIDYAVFKTKEEYFYTLVLNMIILKSINLDYKSVINKFHIEGSFYDKAGLEVVRANNNLIETASIIKKYGACALRFNMLSINIKDNYYYNQDEVIDHSYLINLFKNIFTFNLLTEYRELEKTHKLLIENVNEVLEDNNLPEYIKLLTAYIEEVNHHKKIAFRQAKDLLILFSLIAPSICENINQVTFKSSHPLMYEAWPL